MKLSRRNLTVTAEGRSSKAEGVTNVIEYGKLVTDLVFVESLVNMIVAGFVVFVTDLVTPEGNQDSASVWVVRTI